MDSLPVQIILLIAGFALLIKGADIFVNASVGIAEKLKVPKVLIGLTIVAMGTAAPEIVISVTASVRGSNALAVGNIVGSNIFNLFFIIGLCAMIRAISLKVAEIHKDFWLSIIAALLLIGLKFIGGDYIPRRGSLILLVVFAVYMFFLIRNAMKNKKAAEEENAENENQLVTKNYQLKPQRPMWLVILFAALGLALIIGGGHLTVESATFIASEMNISERIIGLTVVAIGTSLPELIISIVACKKGENEFALGNIIGSNIFNILFILGISGLISPLEVETALIYDTAFLVAGSILAIIFVYTRKRIARAEGAIMVAMFLGYMGWTIFA